MRKAAGDPLVVVVLVEAEEVADLVVGEGDGEDIRLQTFCRLRPLQE